MPYIYQGFDENVCWVVDLYVSRILASEMPIISYKAKKRERLFKSPSFQYKRTPTPTPT